MVRRAAPSEQPLSRRRIQAGGGGILPSRARRATSSGLTKWTCCPAEWTGTS